MALVLILFKIVFHSFVLILIVDNCLIADNISGIPINSSLFESNFSRVYTFGDQMNESINSLFTDLEDQQNKKDSTFKHSFAGANDDELAQNVSDTGSGLMERVANNSFARYLNSILRYGLTLVPIAGQPEDESNRTIASNETTHDIEAITELAKPRYSVTSIAPLVWNSSTEHTQQKSYAMNFTSQKLALLNSESLPDDKKTSLDNYLDDKNDKSHDLSSDRTTASAFEPRARDDNRSERICFSSIDCNVELNERCVKRNKDSVCGCKEPFFRETTSHSCQIKKLVRLLFRTSSGDSKDSNNSVEWIQMKHLIESTIWSVVINSSYLIATVDHIKAVKLKDMQIFVDFFVKIADPSNDFHHKYIEYNFWYRLMSTIRGIEFKAHNSQTPFDLRAIEVVDDINHCSVKELNYCSEFADCHQKPDSEHKFDCRCKPGLTDLSPNGNYPGEVCTLQCSADLCGTAGICEVRNQTEIHCICKNWNFGDRCQYSSHALLAIVSLVGLVSIFFSFCLAAVYCGYKIHHEFVELKKMINANSHPANSIRII